MAEKKKNKNEKEVKEDTPKKTKEKKVKEKKTVIAKKEVKDKKEIKDDKKEENISPSIENNELPKEKIKKPHKEHKIIKRIIKIIILIILIVLYSRYIATYGLSVKEYPINTNELSTSYDGFKIVQFSDVHYGRTILLEELKNIVDEINKQNPDIIVFTGDLIDESAELTEEDINNITSELNRLNPGIETLAVMGEDDYETSYWETITKNLNWIILDNKYEYVYKNDNSPIIFVGLDDYSKGNPDYKNAFSFLNEISEQTYTIVLLHEPDQIDELSNYNFNIAFAGHSHLGQIRLPFIGAVYTPVGSKKYYDEQYNIGSSTLYISNGIGVSNINGRFLNKPSISLYRFYTK